MNKGKRFATYSVILGIAWAFIAGEIFVRVFKKDIISPEENRKNSPQYSRSVFARHIYKRKPLTFEVLPGQKTHINEKGYRGKNFDIKKRAGMTRILFLGGSQVVDQYAPQGEDWPHRVEDNLKRKGKSSVEVINAAVSGNASFDSVGILWAEAHTFEPDYVVLCNTWNDIKYFRKSDTLLRIMEYKEGQVDPRIEYYNWLDKFLSRVSRLYLFLRTEHYKQRIGMEGLKPKGAAADTISDNALKQYKLNLQMFVDCARNIGATPVLMTQPRLFTKDIDPQSRSYVRTDFQGLTYDTLVEAAEAADRIIAQVAREKNVDLIDCSKEMNGHVPYFADHVHLTEAGSAKAAEITARFFQTRLP